MITNKKMQLQIFVCNYKQKDVITQMRERERSTFSHISRAYCWMTFALRTTLRTFSSISFSSSSGSSSSPASSRPLPSESELSASSCICISSCMFTESVSSLWGSSSLVVKSRDAAGADGAYPCWVTCFRMVFSHVVVPCMALARHFVRGHGQIRPRMRFFRLPKSAPSSLLLFLKLEAILSRDVLDQFAQMRELVYAPIFDGITHPFDAITGF